MCNRSRAFFLACLPLCLLPCRAQAADTAGAIASEVIGAAEPTTAASEYGEMVRSSAWQSPEAQRSGFHLPPGFEIRLFAAEPQIAKPLNLAVDDRGRLWMTQTTAYPQPAAGGASPTDAVMILHDTNQDGHADRITTFADGLNIPIGLLPYGDGCLCFSIPNIYYLRDTTGDGVCDRREIVLGPFDTTRDTHGMVNSLRDGGDGWIYACHGFNNRSVIAGTDGHTVHLESGNTFRFRPDGSRIEQVTQGQVNPFGMTRDEWGYWFSADCHSKPITQLIHGACYPSFGRPDDGLGFLPPTVDHLHGSTAISGILAIPSDSPIVPLRGQILSGNVMTSRLNRNRLTYQGATARGTELPDFLTSDDTWFRPVDIQIDQRGNIYVADFYNKIIGHYEVPLNHPDRDRTSGRVWQIRYQGDFVEPVTVDSTQQREQPSWVEQLESGTAYQQIRTLQRAAERSVWPEALRQAIVARLDHENAHVARAAAEAIGWADTPDADTFRLIDKLASIDPADVVLRQTVRIAIRNRLQRREPQAMIWDDLIAGNATPEQADEVASILLAVQGQRIVAPLVRYLRDGRGGQRRRDFLRHAAIHADEANLDAVVTLARELASSSPEEQEQLLDSLLAAQSRFQSGAAASGLLRGWALDLATSAMERFQQATSGDQPLVDWTTSDGLAWDLQQRNLSRGGSGSLKSSHTRGEPYTGVLRSDPFPAPESIGFYLAGHGGPPGQPDHGKNVVRLVRVSDGAVVFQANPPRNDRAVWIHWVWEGQPGEPVRIEAHDGDDGNAYAWLAIGQLEPTWLDQSSALEPLQVAMRWASRLKLRELVDPLAALLNQSRISVSQRAEVAFTLAAIEQDADWQAIFATAKTRASGSELAEALISQFANDLTQRRNRQPPGSSSEQPAEPSQDAFRLLTSHLTVKEENKFVQDWVRFGGTAERLLEACQAGWLNPAVLTQATVMEVLRARIDAAQADRLDQLVAGLDQQPADQAPMDSQWLQAVATSQGDATRGAEVFKRHCAACHQLRGTGAVVGPQLDGVLSRSNERLLEDILMPDRNVDAAFRMTSFLMDDGRVLVGLVQSEAGNQIKIADQTGKLISLEADSIETRLESNRSLMPSNFAETLSAEDLASLFLFMRKP